MTPQGVELFEAKEPPLRLKDMRGWLRRLAPEDWSDVEPVRGHDAVVRSAWLHAMTTLIDVSSIDWLTTLRASFDAEDKLVQQRVCRALGIPSPPAVIATSRDRIPTELGDPVVVKPLGPGHFLDPDDRALVVHATLLALDDPRLDLLGGAPFLVQRRVRAHAHLRIVTVLDSAWVCELEAAGTPFDWRAAERSHGAFRPSSRPLVASAAVRLATRLGVRFSSQDWVIDTEGHEHFLDLNPAGQWLFLPEPVRSDVAEAIADWLARG